MKLQSFHFRGRTEQGVGKWVGSYEILRWLGTIFTGYGTVAGIVGLSLALYSLAIGSITPALNGLLMVGLIHGVVFTSVGLWARSFRRNIQRLKPVEEVSQQLRVDPPTLDRLAQEKGIKPRININGRDYYEISDFSEANILLRGAAAPTADPETLVRPASANSGATSDNLLRAADAEETEITAPEWNAPEQPVKQGLGAGG